MVRNTGPQLALATESDLQGREVASIYFPLSPSLLSLSSFQITWRDDVWVWFIVLFLLLLLQSLLILLLKILLLNASLSFTGTGTLVSTFPC